MRTRATSIVRLLATMRSAVAVASPGVHQPDHHVDREPVRDHDRLGAAVAAGGEQFERAAIGLGAAVAGAVSDAEQWSAGGRTATGAAGRAAKCSGWPR
jgi:hypothetical protein